MEQRLQGKLLEPAEVSEKLEARMLEKAEEVLKSHDCYQPFTEASCAALQLWQEQVEAVGGTRWCIGH